MGERIDERGAASTDLTVGADPAGSDPALVKSAGRVLQILEMFDEIQREARVSEIAERLVRSAAPGLRKLLQRGAPVTAATAMRDAQRTLLKNPQFRHPFYWAGFDVIGAR